MPKFGDVSRRRLLTCDQRLIMVCEASIQRIDFMVLCGHRNKKEQDEAVKNGFSKLKWPRSKHNKSPSMAVDIAPWPLDWNDIGRFVHLADIVLDEGRKLSIKIRWGGDWNRNGKWSDEKFLDLPHFEIDE